MSIGSPNRPGIDAARLQRTGPEEAPSWDGLSDESGPIPTFGPARTDERGRIVMGDEERVARRDAAIRALGAIGGIADGTDTDAAWDEVARRLGGVR